MFCKDSFVLTEHGCYDAGRLEAVKWYTHEMTLRALDSLKPACKEN